MRAVLRRSLRDNRQSTTTILTTHSPIYNDQRNARQIPPTDKTDHQTDTHQDNLKQDAENDQSQTKLESSSGITHKTSLKLTPLEFDLLATFMSYPGRVWNRSQLIEKLWGSDFFGDERVVDTHIARLRKKIEPDPSAPSFVKTVVGVGYRFED